ncbi:hypothetical protein UFOVP1008_10 [uncultured Caudovirales phage]|uniref:Uncharacterized protein n=1 Tax=uncultured Caudovirales phage TaxID=2100421 RepID=A0A6J5R3F6_9CAUD|nr:hypothetical protein UFOVP498_18 [uncultured Caudovirales phage]CAB4177555.1 hypothetical protein UFOVP1008_10 [uncultured Caudovirales phage]CAB4187395.1 hypothetical protein UFOVP1160_36 [uncultured Caudovirales phage]CAB4199788.1 hypothetical protein UFOVP1352_14 [uncultured Caudovirales phage]
MKTHTLFTTLDGGKVLAYYDTHTRVWWAYRVDRHGFQVGDAIDDAGKPGITQIATVLWGDSK